LLEQKRSLKVQNRAEVVPIPLVELLFSCALLTVQPLHPGKVIALSYLKKESLSSVLKLKDEAVRPTKLPFLPENIVSPVWVDMSVRFHPPE
jgi:hypothetical protein